MVQRNVHNIAMYSLPSEANPDAAATVSFPGREPGFVRDTNLRRIVEQMPGILWTTDLELNINFSLGNGLGRLNPMVHPYEGMPLSEFFGDESIHSPILDAHYNALGGYAQSFEIDLDGAVFWGMVEPLFNAEWNLIGTVGSATEITNRKEAEVERVRQLARKAGTEKRQALINFAAGMTQHFARLFDSMSAYAAILSMGLPADHPGQQWLGCIERASQCAVDLTDQMVCSSAPVLHNIEEVNVTELIGEHLATYQAMLSKKITLQVDLEERLSTILGDPAQLRRLLVNLLYNAGSAIGEDGGIITLRTQLTKGPPWPLPASTPGQDVDCDLPEGEYLWLQVSDTGPGLDDEARARIYEPFAGFSGRGIGMGAALAIVSGLRGSMSISSKPGLGTTCHVFLPIVPGDATIPPAPECFF